LSSALATLQAVLDVGCIYACIGITELCKNGWTDQDAVWVQTRMGQRNHVLEGVHKGLQAPPSNHYWMMCAWQRYWMLLRLL